MKKYNNEKPPKYDLSAITINMALLSGDVDEVGDKADIAWLKDYSESGINKDLVVFEHEYHYGHNSFMMSNTM